MSVKELFISGNKALTSKNLTSASLGIEGPGYVESYNHRKDQFQPTVDWSDPSNFCFYGSAEKYYEDAFTRITNFYPYDGSKKEVEEWLLNSSYFDLYVFDKLYPREVGHVKFGYDTWVQGNTNTYNGHHYASSSAPSYITIKGVMNTGSSANNAMQVLADGFDRSNELLASENREQNLKFNLNSGSTVEFWYKNGTTVQSSCSVLFDLWTGDVTSSAGVDNDTYGRYTLELTGSSSGSQKLLVTAQSATYGPFQQSLGFFTASTDWNHYSVRTYNSGNYVNSDFYLNGGLHSSANFSSSVALNEITGSLIANIGAFRTNPSGSVDMGEGWGSLSGSMDEFRYWKVKRTHEQIGRWWFTQVGGGTNTDTSNTSLGVYYKFNESVTQTSSIDSLVLDYSGRVSNGAWTGYVSGSRVLTSAMVEASAAESEFADPIIYWFHPSVLATKTDYMNIGVLHDTSNNSSIIDAVPAWIMDENPGEVRNLSQIIGQYFDNLHLQIKELPKIQNFSYTSASLKPYPFSSKLLTSKGFIAPEILSNVTELEALYNRDEDRDFEDKLYNIKNLIYQNVYNNLIDIYKMKGTETAFRNLIRCFGVDEELIKINYYANNQTYEIRNNFRIKSVGRKFVDFNDVSRFNGTIYQYTSSLHPESVSYISGTALARTEENFPFTVEADILMPRKPPESSKGYASSSFGNLSASLFGLYGAVTGNLNDTTWATGTFGVNFNVHAIRDHIDHPNVYFQLSSNTPSVVLTSSLFEDVYDNEVWTLAVRIFPEKIENAGIASGSASGSSGYIMDFYGVSTIMDQERHSFHVSSSISYEAGSNLLCAPKRIYAGARKTNFTGSNLEGTDVRLGALRAWLSYLDNETFRIHNRDVENYGHKTPYRGFYDTRQGINRKNIPEIKTLLLNWEFDSITGSDANGQFLVNDISSGSTEVVDSYRLGNIFGNQHTGRGDGFNANVTAVVDKNFQSSAKQQLPEMLNSFDMVQILEQDDEVFTRESRPIKHFISFEKNMNQNISEDMLNWFSTMTEFHRLIGSPINRYQINYNLMEKLRTLYFKNINSAPSFDKYVDFYKWFDSGLSKMLQELVPLSARTSNRINNVIENNILSRSKYHHKYPTMEYTQQQPIGGMNTINRHLYNWKFSHAPINAAENENCFWWKERAERSGSVITSGDVSVDETRAAYLTSSYQALSRGWSTTYKMTLDDESPMNKLRNKRRDYYKSVRDTTGDGPESDGSGFKYLWFTRSNSYKGSAFAQKDCVDEYKPNTKRKFLYWAEADDASGFGLSTVVTDDGYLTPFKGDLYFPFTIMSSSVSGGYIDRIVSNTLMHFDIGPDIHHDLYAEFESTPLQGHFSNQHEGGHKYRHVELNDGTDAIGDRLEGFWVVPETSIGSFCVLSPHTDNYFLDAFGTTLPSHPFPRDYFYRDQVAKRPFTIKNIQTLTGSKILGNYQKNYEVLTLGDRRTNNRFFVQNGGVSQATAEIVNLSGNLDFEIPDRSATGSDSVLVERFSAPGSMNETSPGYLDTESEQYGIYNTVNYRNNSIRRTFTKDSYTTLDQGEFT